MADQTYTVEKPFKASNDAFLGPDFESGPARLKVAATLIQQVNDDQAAVEIVATKGTAYLVPAAESRGLLKTAYLLRSPRNAQELCDSVAEAQASRMEHRELLC